MLFPYLTGSNKVQLQFLYKLKAADLRNFKVLLDTPTSVQSVGSDLNTMHTYVRKWITVMAKGIALGL